MGEKVGKKVGEEVGEKTGEKVGESLGEIDNLNLCRNTKQKNYKNVSSPLSCGKNIL